MRIATSLDLDAHPTGDGTGVVVRAFEHIGWSWGGKWHSPLEYMHFSATNG